MIQAYTDGQETYLISAGKVKEADTLAKMVKPYDKKAGKFVKAYNPIAIL